MKAYSKNPVLTQKFITEFNCTGGLCEDDCCHGWRIPVEKKVFLDLKKSYQDVSCKKSTLSSALKHDKESVNEWFYGLINIQPDQPCPFLNQDGLCDIHTRFGPDKLGWVCKDYPHSLVKNSEQIELVMTLSCPEAARLCLLKSDSTQLVETSPSILNNASGHLNIPPDNAACAPYFQLYNDIRQIILLLADAHQYDTNGRLYLLVYFACRINYFFHANSTSFSIEKLNSEIEHIADPDIHSRLVREFHAQPFNPALSISVTHALLTFQSDYKSEFNEFIQSCLKSCKGINTEGLDSLNRESMAEIMKTFYERRQHLEETHWGHLEGYFNNYLLYYCFNKWYLNSPSLITYLRTFIVQLSIIKFLFFLNPLLNPLLDPDREINKENSNEDKELLNKAIVQTVYRCARGFEHLQPQLLKAISQALDDQGINNLEQLSMLAKT